MSKRRIVHIIPTLDQSGAEKQLALLASNLPKERYDVTVLALTRGGHYEKMLADAGVPVKIIGKKFKGDPFALKRLASAIKKEKPDLVQTWLFAGNAYGRIAAKWAGAPRVLASERCVDSWKSGSQLLVDRMLVPWTTAYVVNSQAVKNFYVGQRIAPDRIHVIPNAVPPAPDVDREKIRKQLGFSDDRFVIGFIGRLWPQKRLEDLLLAFEFLNKAEWPIELVVVGDGPRREVYERLIGELGLQSQTHMLGHRNDAQQLLAGFDALVLPSIFEGMPNVVLEAMQAGVPVVATRIPGTDEIVEDGDTGLLVPKNSPVAIATALQKLIQDRTLGQRLADNAKRVVAERYSVPTMVEAYVKLYDELIETRPTSVEITR